MITCLGRFIKCDDMVQKKKWDTKAGLGREKIFEVRRIYNDVGFIDTFLTADFARRHKLFTYRYDAESKQYVIDSREFDQVKRQLLFSLTNFGQPIVVVQDGNYSNRGELLLRHEHEGVDLKLDWTLDTLENLHTVWSRPVHLKTTFDDTHVLLSFDGEQHSEVELKGA